MLEVKNWAFFMPYKIDLANFESSWLKTFVLHKVEAFDIALGNWVENPWKNKKIQKTFVFIF
jgi:hypothetical protein